MRRRTRRYLRIDDYGTHRWAGSLYHVPVPRWWELWRWPVFALCCTWLRARGYTHTKSHADTHDLQNRKADQCTA